jgi:DNA topoisomerase II
MVEDKDKKKKPWLSNFTEYHTDSTVDFRIEMTAGQISSALSKDPYKHFSLVSKLSQTNMNLFNASGQIQKYANTLEILQEFFVVRLRLYKKRKDYLVEQLKTLWERLTNQARFITLVIEGKFIISKKKKSVLLQELSKLSFARFNKVCGLWCSYSPSRIALHVLCCVRCMFVCCVMNACMLEDVCMHAV